MSITTQLTHSNEAWKLLRGLICLYKPPGYPASSLYGMLKNRITDDLNCMERAVHRDEALHHSLRAALEGPELPVTFE